MKKLDVKNYPGSKGSSGMIQFICNNVPKAKVFKDVFGGSGRVSDEFINSHFDRIEIDEIFEGVVDQLKEKYKGINKVNIQQKNSLYHYFDPNFQHFTADIEKYFFYCDPPYLFNTRKSQTRLYNCEWSREQHIFFLNGVNSSQFKFNCMISHPECELYNENLKGWKKKTITVMHRGGPAEETIYMNYNIDKMLLATTKHVGADYTERQRIKRKRASMINKLNRLPIHEKQHIIEEIQKQVISIFSPGQSKTTIID